MKSFKVILSVIALLALGLSFLAFYQFQQRAAVRKAVNDKKAVVDEAIIYKKKSAELEKELFQLQDKLERMERKVSADISAPLALLEQISLAANKNGLKQVSFEYVGKKEPAADEQKKVKKTKKSPRSSNRRSVKKNEPVTAQTEITPLRFTLEFEGEYSDLISFTKDLYSLERLVSVEKVLILRDISILPRQKITLDLVAYSFAK